MVLFSLMSSSDDNGLSHRSTTLMSLERTMILLQVKLVILQKEELMYTLQTKSDNGNSSLEVSYYDHTSCLEISMSTTGSKISQRAHRYYSIVR